MKDWEMTAEQLDAKYNPDGDGEHPEIRRIDWREAVENEETLSGYWEWLLHQLHMYQDNLTEEGEENG